MSFLEYEKSTNLFVQAMKGTSLGATLKTITAARWAVLVPQSVILEELGLGVVSKEFLLTHTVVFNNKTPADTSFVTLNGLKGEFITTKGDAQSDGTACDSVIVDLPIEPSMSTTTPFGPATASAHCSSDDDDDSDHKSDVPSKVPSQPSVVSPKANSPTAQAILVNGRATPADSIPEEPVLQPNQQSIHVLRQTELVSEGDGFTIPVYLVADAIRAKWLSSEHNKLGWYREKRQEPRNAPHPPAKTGAISPDLYADGTNGGDAKSADGKAAGGSSPAQKPRPKFRFRDFAEKMRNSKAQDLHRMLRTFVADVNGGAIPAEQLPQRVQDFLAKMSTEIRGNPVWKDGSEQELDFAQEGLEKYVLTKIFNRTFGTDEDRKNDEALEKRLESFKFISPENLEVRSEVLQHPTWKEATQELQKLNEYKNPRDKLICITNSCKLIFSVLHSLEPGKAMGADDFLPCLILLVGKAEAKNLHSNTNFIQKYRNESKMCSEAGYYFCTLQSAIHFWETADASSLRISQDQLDDINRRLADKPTPDFSDVAIDEGDWELEKTLRSKASLYVERNQTPTEGLDSVVNRNRSNSPAIGDLSKGATTSSALVCTASDEVLKKKIRAALAISTPSATAAGLPADPAHLTVGHLDALHAEWKRLTKLHHDVSRLLKEKS